MKCVALTQAAGPIVEEDVSSASGNILETAPPIHALAKCTIEGEWRLLLLDLKKWVRRSSVVVAALASFFEEAS